MKRALFLLSIVLIFSGCKDRNSFSVKGHIREKNKQGKIYLSKVGVDNITLLDSAKINKKGEFSLKNKATEAGFYQVGLSPENFITLLAEPGEKIGLEFGDSNLSQNYSVIGSEGSEKLRMLDLDLAGTNRKLDSLTVLYNNESGKPGFEERKTALEKEFNSLMIAQRKRNIEFIIRNTGSLASIKALYQMFNPQTYVLYNPTDVQFMKIVRDSLSKYYPKSAHVQALARDLEKEMNQLYASQLGSLADKLPASKLDPVLTDVSGKKVALSSLRGKYVLLTFWSVKSKECIAENMQLKDYYMKYNRKGFEIYQVNLDRNEEEWKYAVKFDELPWISTREDDPSNPKTAILFNVTTLPANYLFDRDGNIIGTNLHGRSLMLKLGQLFNN